MIFSNIITLKLKYYEITSSVRVFRRCRFDSKILSSFFHQHENIGEKNSFKLQSNLEIRNYETLRGVRSLYLGISLFPCYS